VRNLQLLLKDLNYFNNKDTAIYWNITKQAIISFQLDNDVILNDTDLGAGNFWPATKMNLIQTLSKRYYEELVEMKNYDKEIITKIKNQVL
jgi:peptidoglycan hydrolase-like protein with peptidoglycan-binding domain